ncbi:hypothetical protein ACFELO_02720 [Oceanicaulis sp. LC35]|uniref:hypothetical protein n=1 Tax=Oceanicaulis sp. LC35 TaxID=3349635 RepID=UPI003F83253F
MTRVLDIIMPETASAPSKARQRYILRSSLIGGALGMLIGLSAVGSVPDLALIVSPILLVALVYEFSALMRALDELQSRIHMTALALGGAASATFMTSWALLVSANILPRSDIELAFGLPLMGLGYYLSLFFVSRRYE